MPLESTKSRVPLGCLDRCQADDGLAAARNNDLLALLGTRDQPGKLGLGLVDRDGRYFEPLLAKVS